MFKILKKSNAMERAMALFSVAFIAFQVYLDLKIPDYMSDITKLLQEKGTTTSDIMTPGFKMIGLSLASFASSLIVGFFAARIAAGLSRRLRAEVYDQVLDYSTAEIQKFSVPSLVTRTTNDITQIQMLIAMGLQVVVKGPITAVWAIVKISNKNWQWTATTAVAVVVLIVLITTLLVFVRPKFQILQSLTDKLNAVTRENLSGIRVIRAYNAEDFQNDKFEKANDTLTGVNLFTGRMMAIMSPSMTLISTGLTLAVYWIGAYLIQDAVGMDKITTFSDMVVFTSYAMQVVMGFMFMIMIFLILPRASVAAGRINEVLDLKPSIQFPEKSVEPTTQGEIEFKNVSFAYPDAAEPVLHDINFKVRKGDTVAFIGSTGSGKSTIISLIPRLYDTTNGEIKIDGHNIKEYSHEKLNNIVGYIPQKAVLFTGDIRSNMEIGESAASPLTDDAINEALEIGQAADFVAEKEDKLNSSVAQGGQNFSGGQKQRLGISRVIARRPEILIFDDSFSALDYATDKKLRAALNDKLEGTTKLIVAQRISTIMDADQIIVLDSGRVVGHGTHQDLLAKNEVYQEIAYSQLSKEELANAND